MSGVRDTEQTDDGCAYLPTTPVSHTYACPSPRSRLAWKQVRAHDLCTCVHFPCQLHIFDQLCPASHSYTHQWTMSGTTVVCDTAHPCAWTELKWVSHNSRFKQRVLFTWLISSGKGRQRIVQIRTYLHHIHEHRHTHAHAHAHAHTHTHTHTHTTHNQSEEFYQLTHPPRNECPTNYQPPTNPHSALYLAFTRAGLDRHACPTTSSWQLALLTTQSRKQANWKNKHHHHHIRKPQTELLGASYAHTHTCSLTCTVQCMYWPSNTETISPSQLLGTECTQS